LRLSKNKNPKVRRIKSFKMNSNKLPKREIIILALGEALIGAILTAIYLLIGKFDYTVVLGALLGGTVTVFNFIFLSIAVNRAVDDAMKNYEARKNENAIVTDTVTEEKAEDSEEQETEADAFDDEAAKFAKENAAKITNAVKLSYIVRTASVVITLVVAFLTKQFNVITTVIPLLCLRPILTVSELIRRKGGKA